jgi:hypothetical protein
MNGPLGAKTAIPRRKNRPAQLRTVLFCGVEHTHEFFAGPSPEAELPPCGLQTANQRDRSLARNGSGKEPSGFGASLDKASMEELICVRR